MNFAGLGIPAMARKAARAAREAQEELQKPITHTKRIVAEHKGQCPKCGHRLAFYVFDDPSEEQEGF